MFPLRFTAVAAALLALVGLASTFTPEAGAHERRTVAGAYTFVVGFLAEPVFLEEPNGIDLRITNAQTNEPVEGVEKTLKADMTVGGQTKTVDLRARFGQPGAYTADVIPTRGGTWTFRFYGDIQGTRIDERFESGPGRFNEPQPKSEIQFPVKQPTVGELVEQVQRTGQPSEAAQPSGGTADVQRALDRADSARSLAMIFGGAGVLVGLIGLGVALVALRSRPQGAASPRQSEPI